MKHKWEESGFAECVIFKCKKCGLEINTIDGHCSDAELEVYNSPCPVEWQRWSEVNLPKGGRNLIILDEDGDKLFAFRCSCHKGCQTLKCAITGVTYLIEPKFWKYCEEWPQVDEIDFLDLL